ncbi:MAG: RtcB family protein [Candidatus Krumholzibacteriia bacterium]
MGKRGGGKRGKPARETRKASHSGKKPKRAEVQADRRQRRELRQVAAGQDTESAAEAARRLSRPEPPAGGGGAGGPARGGVGRPGGTGGGRGSGNAKWPLWRDSPVPYRTWGTELDPAAVQQMDNAVRLPIAVAGALMPDAHVGYGLPIGGVLATEGAVIPYAVGMDIACRMKLTVLDWPATTLQQRPEALVDAIETETAFGTGAAFARPRHHDVLDDDWSVSPVTAREKDNARRQLGSSGSGNHFVEFGELVLDAPELGLQPGRYLALLSHSGSRNPGLQVATHYSRLARERHPELPREMQHLAWLDLDTEPGREYWLAMQLMGRYAAANHELIHRHLLTRLGAQGIAGVENHHNFAWEEEHDGRQVVVHRKGATPAGRGVLGVIPGSMAHPGFVVRGLGHPDSLDSAAHGAGRAMSRGEAMKRFSWSDVEPMLKQRGVTLLSAGLDEVPLAYKDIEQVMAAQRDLVQVVARFEPRLVKMAPGKRGWRRR